MFKNHTGINLTETKLQLVEIGCRDNSFYLETVDQAPHSETLSPYQNEDKIISIIQTSFDKIIKKNPITSRSISFALPNNFFKIFEVPYEDSLIKKDLHEHFLWELSILFPECNKDSFFIQHIEVDKSLVRREKVAIIFAIDKAFVNSLNKFCLQNQCELKFIDNVHLASNAFLYLDGPQSGGGISLSIYIDSKYSSVAALDGVQPFSFNILNPNSTNLYEELKTSVNRLNEYNISKNDFRRVLLYGQDVTFEFENKLNDFFGIPIKKVNPFERLKVEDGMINNHFYKLRFNSFTAAAGIAIRII